MFRSLALPLIRRIDYANVFKNCFVSEPTTIFGEDRKFEFIDV